MGRAGEGRAIAAFLTASAIWGSTFLVISLGNATMPPLWAATLRLLLAAAILFAVLALTRTPVPRGAALKAAVLYGVFEFGINFGLLYWGETTVPSGIAAVFYATIPLSSALFARLFGLERIDARKLLAALIAFAGVAVIFRGEISSSVSFVALAAVLAAAILAALAGVFLKRGPPQSAIGANAVGAAVGAAILLPASFVFGESHAIPAEPRAWLPIVYLALTGSVIAFVLFAWLLNRWSVTRTSFVSVLIPVIAFALGAIVKGETPAPITWLGAALVVAGIVVAVRAPEPESAATRAGA